MGRETRPIYVCDNCKKEFLDKHKVRRFIEVTDGEGEHFYVGRNIYSKDTPITHNADKLYEDDNFIMFTNIYCIDCIPGILKLDLKKGQIKDFPSAPPLKNPVSTHVDPKEPVQEVKSEECVVEVIKLEDQENIPNPSQQAELELCEPAEENKSENEESEEDISYSEDLESLRASVVENDKYVVLGMIQDEKHEEAVAKYLNYTNSREMRGSYGGPLIGLYVPADQTAEILPDNTAYKKIGYITKVVFGIPERLEAMAYVVENESGTFAYVEKEDYDPGSDVEY